MHADGLTPDERQTQMSLWALAASPLILGTDLTGLTALTGGQPATATETFTDNGAEPVRHVQLSLSAPAGWTVTATSAASFSSVGAGQSVQTTFQVVAPPPATLFKSDTVTATAMDRWDLVIPQQISESETVTTSPPVGAPYQTYSSATDAPAAFAESGQQFGLDGAGADLFSGSDAYSTIYLKGAVGSASTVVTEVTSQQGMTGFAKAGIMVRNDITGSGTSPEGVILFESPSGGIQLEWDNNGGNFINSVTPPNGTIPGSLPVWLELQRSGTTYTGYYSYDGQNWLTVGSATVPGQAATQDAGIFVTSHASGSPGTPPPLATSYEAESSANTIAVGASAAACRTCSGGAKAGFVGAGGTLTFNNVNVAAAGTYEVAIAYLDGSATGRQATISVNGAAPQMVSFTPTESFSTVGAMTVPLQLAAGNNTIEFANPAAFAPDFDRIIVPAAAG